MNTPPLIDRFWARVEIRGPNDCWEWQSGTHGRGYGKFSDKGKSSPNPRVYQAHRWIYEYLNGPQPGLDICHRCDNVLCCNPAHLFAGTRTQNMRDCATKGRNAIQRDPKKNHFYGNKTVQARGEAQGNSKLTTEMVIEMRRMSQSGAPSAEIGRRFGVNAGHARRIVCGQSWAHVPMPGKAIEASK